MSVCQQYVRRENFKIEDVRVCYINIFYPTLNVGDNDMFIDFEKIKIGIRIVQDPTISGNDEKKGREREWDKS